MLRLFRHSFLYKFFFALIFFLQVFVSHANINFLSPVTNLVAYNAQLSTPWLFAGLYLDEMEVNNSFSEIKSEIYEKLGLEAEGLSREAFDYALHGMEKLLESGYAFKDNILSIADFSQPSTQRRLYIIDLNNYSLLYHTYVAHGRNTGKSIAEQFSNKMSSFKSSLGFYITGNTYRGKHGYSLKLEGLESGINDNAGRRAIVVHGAEYVDENVIGQLGYLGRSQGCPAIPVELHKPIIDNIKDGTCLFIYHPSEWYINNSRMLN